MMDDGWMDGWMDGWSSPVPKAPHTPTPMAQSSSTPKAPCIPTPMAQSSLNPNMTTPDGSRRMHELGCIGSRRNVIFCALQYQQNV